MRTLYIDHWPRSGRKTISYRWSVLRCRHVSWLHGSNQHCENGAGEWPFPIAGTCQGTRNKPTPGRSLAGSATRSGQRADWRGPARSHVSLKWGWARQYPSGIGVSTQTTFELDVTDFLKSPGGIQCQIIITGVEKDPEDQSGPKAGCKPIIHGWIIWQNFVQKGVF